MDSGYWYYTDSFSAQIVHAYASDIDEIEQIVLNALHVAEKFAAIITDAWEEIMSALVESGFMDTLAEIEASTVDA